MRSMRRIALGVLTLSALAALACGCQSVHPLLRPDPGVTGYAACGPYSVQRSSAGPALPSSARDRGDG